MTTVETAFGHVDSDALERLRSEYDTMQILRAVDRLDQARSKMEELREMLLALHGMAAHVLRDNFISGPKYDDVSDIHELVDVIESGGFHLIETGEALRDCADPLRSLDSDECIAVSEGYEG